MDMKKMMKQAQKMQRDAALAQQELANAEFSAVGGGSMVSAVVSGDGKLLSLEIDPQACESDNAEILQDTVVAVVNDALEQANEAANEKMNAAMGGMNIPGLM